MGAQIHHLRVKNHKSCIQHGKLREDSGHHGAVNDRIQHGAAFVHSDHHSPLAVFPGAAAEIDLFQGKALLLRVIMLQVPSDRLFDIQIPDGFHRTRTVPVQGAQKRTADLFLKFFRNLLRHLPHNPPGRIQDLALHQMFQLQNRFQKLLIGFQLFQNLLIRQKLLDLIPLQGMPFQNLHSLSGKQAPDLCDPGGGCQTAGFCAALPAHVLSCLPGVKKVQGILQIKAGNPIFQGPVISKGKLILRVFSQYQPPPVQNLRLSHPVLPLYSSGLDTAGPFFVCFRA